MKMLFAFLDFAIVAWLVALIIERWDPHSPWQMGVWIAGALIIAAGPNRRDK